MPTIAIDTHSGTDSGVRIAVRAAAKVSMTTSIDVLVVGSMQSIEEVLSQTSYNPECLRIRGSENPSENLRVTMELVASGEADGMVTTVDPTQVHGVSLEGLRLIPGVNRAPMAALIPTAPRPGNRDPFALVLDVSGQQDCDAQALVTWARMGTAYASRISRVEAPTVGLLSTDEDPLSGPSTVVEAHQILSADARIRFVGNITGVDIPRGAADVVVCNGFVGQVMLGLLGGIGDALRDVAQGAWTQRPTWRLGLRLLGGAVMQFQELTEHKSYGGAPLLGYDHVVICALPHSGVNTLANAIKLAAKAHRDDVVSAVRTSVSTSS